MCIRDRFLTEDFEFYHDRGGLTKSREAEMKSMTAFCGEQRQRQKLRRELIQESIEVSPIKNFGAVETLSLIHISEPTRPY